MCFYVSICICTFFYLGIVCMFQRYLPSYKGKWIHLQGRQSFQNVFASLVRRSSSIKQYLFLSQQRSMVKRKTYGSCKKSFKCINSPLTNSFPLIYELTHDKYKNVCVTNQLLYQCIQVTPPPVPREESTQCAD